jgi:8-oxo-dGTP pyrophosphatase MutT (NUDIX family)
MSYTQEIRSKIGHDLLIVVGAGVFIYKENKVLLQKRRDNGFWSFHGGGVEIGESVEAAAKRELYEETGLIANTMTLLGVFSGEDMLYTYPNGDQVYIVGIYYACSDFSGEMMMETEETLELKWFDIGELPQEISIPDTKPMQAFVEYIKT